MTETTVEAPPLDPSWNEPVRHIPEAGLERTRGLTPGETAALVAALDLLALPAFEASYRIRSSAQGRYLLKGRIRAVVEQTCVVSLKPMRSEIVQDLDIAFWPAADIAAPESGAIDIEDEAEPEPIEDGMLPVARVVFETLASAIDPFPRAPDAKLDWTPPADADAKVSPFAALAKLKK
jgi:uncharacterized metal-binding protein YceD (DUF177 family)